MVFLSNKHQDLNCFDPLATTNGRINHTHGMRALFMASHAKYASKLAFLRTFDFFWERWPGGGVCGGNILDGILY